MFWTMPGMLVFSHWLSTHVQQTYRNRVTVGQRRPKPSLLQQENIGTFFTPAGKNPLPLPNSWALGWDGNFGMELKFLPLPGVWWRLLLGRPEFMNSCLISSAYLIESFQVICKAQKNSCIIIFMCLFCKQDYFWSFFPQ